MTPEEITRAEELVNQWVAEDHPVKFTEYPTQEALDMGAIGPFGERYGDTVKVYQMGTDDHIVSLEICGGPHVDHTGQLARGIGGAGTTRTANAGRVVELRVAPGVRVAAKSGDGLIDASKVRFTQDSAGSTFSDGRSVLDLADDMARTGKAPEGLPQIRLFEQDGKLYSLDNRRLFAGQYAGVKLPYRMATPAEIAARNQTQVFDGTSIMIRFPGTTLDAATADF